MTRPRLSSPAQPVLVRVVLRAVEALASLKLAVVLIAGIAAVLAWATWLEHRYGTKAVHFGVYGSGWFASLIGLLGANVLAATLVRFLSRRPRVGFVLTHAGTLVLLAGCLLTWLGGIDAQLPVFEQTAAHRAFVDSQHFELTIDASAEAPAAGEPLTSRTEVIRIPFAPGPFNWADYRQLAWFPWRLARRDQGVLYDHDGIRLELLDYVSDSKIVPVPPLRLRAKGAKAGSGTRSGGEGKPQPPSGTTAQAQAKPADSSDHDWQTVELALRDLGDSHASHRRMAWGGRQELSGGQQIAFWVAANQAETEAFLQSLPEEPLGSQGQVVLFVAGRKYALNVEALARGSPVPLGDTSLRVELVQLDPRRWGLALRVLIPGQDPRRLMLLADYPEFNQQDELFGIYGTYWAPAPADRAGQPEEKARGALRGAGRPRIDLLQGADRKLYCRAWRSPRAEWVGQVDAQSPARTAFTGTDDEVIWQLEQFVPYDRPGGAVQPLPFSPHKNPSQKARRALVRLWVGPTSEEFWLDGLEPTQFRLSPREGQRRVVHGAGRRAMLTLAPDEVDLGFQVFLHRFNRRLDPGTSMASHYSSLVDFLARTEADESSDPPASEPVGPTLRSNVLITLNEPASFIDPQTGRTYRLFQESFNGPWKAGDELFDQIVPAGSTKDQLFVSFLTVNYDPGRGLKYLGSLLVVLGMAVVFFMKGHLRRRRRAELRRGLPAAAVIVLTLGASCGAHGAAAAELAPADWEPWVHLPVLHDGRIKPTDTFARQLVQTVCGCQRPVLSLAGADSGNALGARSAHDAAALFGDGLAEARSLFPDGKARAFSPAELLFSWIVEPERWERVPFLVAANQRLRREILDVPLVGPDGERLRYVSPWQLAQAEKFHARWDQILQNQRRARDAAERYEPDELDRAVQELAEAYGAFRFVSFRPDAPGAVRRRFVERFAELAHVWHRVQSDLERLPNPGGEGPLAEVTAFSEALRQLHGLVFKQRVSSASGRNSASPEQTGMASGSAPASASASASPSGSASPESPAVSLSDIPLAEADRWVAKLREAAGALGPRVQTLARRLAQSPPGIEAAELEPVRIRLRALEAATVNLARLAEQLHLALYDNGQAMTLVPGLSAQALERDRDPSDEIHPWLSIQAVLFGSESLLRSYPQAELSSLREAYARLASVYTRREDPARAEQFGPAMQQFVDAVRGLGEAIEPLRDNLPIKHRDDALMAATAYPPPGSTRLEVHYNRLDPFGWSWMFWAAGGLLAALAWGRCRAGLFWSAVVFVAGGVVLAGYGLGLRTAITGRAPVTNMFETVIFVALVVALLGLWFTLWPVLGRGVRAAWQWTAAPGTWEVPALLPEHLALWNERLWRLGHWILLGPRMLLACAVFAALALVPYGQGEASTAIRLWPRTAATASVPTLDDLIVWLQAIAVLGLCVWYVPRVVVAMVLSIGTVPYVWLTHDRTKPLAQALDRKPFVMAAAVVASLTAYLACHGSVFDPTLGPLMAVLKNNFWLASHVMTITASYGGGALAWVLANVALAYYLLGSYREPAGDSAITNVPGVHRPARADRAPVHAFARRPPEICNWLARFIYKAMKVTVLALTIGTILGALWADVSWGRFWGWDPKEVWALISLLIYLAVLHGRYAGWFRDFSVVVGAVLGATSLLMAWYGVNYVLRIGKHAYAEGSGGVRWVLAAVAINWLFVLAAAVRYHLEIRRPARTAP